MNKLKDLDLDKSSLYLKPTPLVSTGFYCLDMDVLSGAGTTDEQSLWGPSWDRLS